MCEALRFKNSLSKQIKEYCIIACEKTSFSLSISDPDMGPLSFDPCKYYPAFGHTHINMDQSSILTELFTLYFGILMWFHYTSPIKELTVELGVLE